MKKLLFILLPALMSAGSLLSQTTSTISGVWERKSPEAVKMFKVTGGGLSEVASSPLGQGGSFSMTFAPDGEGYYALGLSAAKPQDRYTFYLKPGDPLHVHILPESYQLMGTANTAENKEIARWHDFVYPLEDMSVYFQGKNKTYVDFFPLLDQKLGELPSYTVHETNNKTFDAAFANYRKFDLLQIALLFVYSPHSSHPQGEDFGDYYRAISVAELSQNTDILQYPGGINLLMSAYMMQLTLADLSEEDKQAMIKNPAWGLLKKDGGLVANDILKGEIALMFARYNTTLEGLEDYKKEYSSYLATDDQKARWERITDNFKPGMTKTDAINFTFPDVNGNDVSLSKYRGKVVYIDIWATWCGPCKREFPHMKTLEAEYKDNPDMVFMGISVDASKDIRKWKDFLVKEQLPGVQLFAGDLAGPALSVPYKITGIPRFMLVGKDGSLIYMNAPRPSSSEIRAVLNDALKK